MVYKDLRSWSFLGNCGCGIAKDDDLNKQTKKKTIAFIFFLDLVYLVYELNFIDRLSYNVVIGTLVIQPENI